TLPTMAFVMCGLRGFGSLFQDSIHGHAGPPPASGARRAGRECVQRAWTDAGRVARPYNGVNRNSQGTRMIRWLSGKIKAGLSKTKGVFTGVFDLLRGKGRVDQAFLDELEKRLYLADVGTQATALIVDRVRQAFRDKEITGEVETFVRQQ